LILAKILLQAGAELDAQDKKGKTALFYAIEKGNDKAIEFLLNRGASLELRDKKGNPPLLYAFQRYHYDNAFFSSQTKASKVIKSARLFDLVQDFLFRGADVNAANNEGVTPLMLAHGKLMRLLLRYGANASAVTNDGTSVAMYHPYLSALQLLKKYGVDITASNRWGDDVLLLSYPNYRFVRTLIEKFGFSANDKNNRNETILHQACEFGEVRLVRYLIKHGANPNVRDAQGKTPYDYLFQRTDHGGSDEDYEILDILDKCTEKETENLFCACRQCNVRRIMHALEYGAIVQRIKGRNSTVMTVAAAQFECRKDISADVFRKVVRLLREAGADINAVDMDGHCVLLALIRRHEVDLLQEFLSEGADPTVRSH